MEENLKVKMLRVTSQQQPQAPIKEALADRLGKWKSAHTSLILADGETASLGNIPYDVKYTVTESDYKKDGYSIAMKKDDKGTVSAAEQTASFTNTKTGEIDTGINLTTLPYILVFAGVIVIAGAAFITRRRRYED